MTIEAKIICDAYKCPNRHGVYGDDLVGEQDLKYCLKCIKALNQLIDDSRVEMMRHNLENLGGWE